MNIHIRTLAIVLTMAGLIEVFAFLLQYLIIKTYRGIGWWALGYALVAIGFSLMILRDVVSLALTSIIIPNALLVLGLIFVYFGARRFFGNKIHGGVALSIFSTFLLSVFYYTYVNNDINVRTAFLGVASAIIAFMIAHCLFEKRTRSVSASAYFTSAVFFAFGCHSIFRSLATLTISPISSLFTPSLIQASGFLVPFATGISATFGFIIMVNQRSNAEMKEAKEKFEAIFSTSPDASVITRLNDGLIVDVNERFTELFGLPRNEIIGKPNLDFDIWVDPSARQKVVDELKEKGYCRNYEAIFQIGAGNQITGMMSAKLISLMDIQHVISVTRDITERKRAEEALRESERRLRAIFESTEEAIITLDDEQRCLEANPAAGMITGVPNDQLVGRFLREFFYSSSDISSAWEAFLKTGRFRGEVRIRHSSGSLRIVDASGMAHIGPGRHFFVGHDITERKRAEEALKESEERFRVMADGSPVMIWATDAAGRVEFVNRAYVDFFGTTLEAIQSRGWEPLVHPDDKDYVQEYSNCLAQRKPFCAQARVRRHDGEWRWVESFGHPRFSLSGKFLGLVGISPDITNRKRAEEVLSGSERRHRELAAVLEAERGKLKTIIDNLPVGLWIADTSGKMIQINDNARSIWGGVAPSANSSVDDYQVYKAWWADTGKLITAEDMPMARSLRGEICKNMAVDFERFDGTRGTQLVSSAPIKTSDGAGIGAIAIVQDITDRKRAEEVLRESEERQSFLLELSDRLRPLSDARKIMTAASEVLARRLGLSCVGYCEIEEDGETVVAGGEYSDGRMPSLNNFRFRQPTDSDFLRSLHSGEDLFYENNRNDPRTVCEDVVIGESIQFVAGAAIPLIKDGHLVAYLFAVHPEPRPWPGRERRLMREVAERTWGAVQRARAEKALRESEQRYKSLSSELELRVKDRTAELERKNRELQEFAFVASHDLSEPLRKIQTFGTLLEEKSADRLSEEERDYISRMTGAADRMRELLDALLRYSRVDTKGKDFILIKLNDVVQDAASDLEVQIRKVGAHVEIGPLPSIKCDPYQWRQLFQNLISNATKYHRSEVKPFIRIYGEERGGDCRIFVEDNGIGFEEKYLDKIFLPFQRLHGRNEYPGTGIGLAICKKIVERHGGTITAKSTPWKGSIFIVTLPVDRAKTTSIPE